MGIGIRLKAILREKNMTIKQLSQESGVSLNTLYSITKRDSDNIDSIILQKISSALNISEEELTGQLVVRISNVTVETENGECITASMNTREGKLLKNFQALNPLGKDEVIRFSDILLEANKFRRKPLGDTSQE